MESAKRSAKDGRGRGDVGNDIGGRKIHTGDGSSPAEI